MLIIKLGGSLLGHPQLHQLLGNLSQYPSCIIVPGGGIYADQVRKAQSIAGFDDESAHFMAIAAMNQSAQVLQQMAPSLTLLQTQQQLLNAIENRQSVIWQPYQMLSREPDLPRNWQVSSDSIAAWLAHQVRLWTGAVPDLVLVKSMAWQDLQAVFDDANDWRNKLKMLEVVDDYLCHFLQLNHLACYLSCMEKMQDLQLGWDLSRHAMAIPMQA